MTPLEDPGGGRRAAHRKARNDYTRDGQGAVGGGDKGPPGLVGGVGQCVWGAHWHHQHRGRVWHHLGRSKVIGKVDVEILSKRTNEPANLEQRRQYTVRGEFLMKEARVVLYF